MINNNKNIVMRSYKRTHGGKNSKKISSKLNFIKSIFPDILLVSFVLLIIFVSVYFRFFTPNVEINQSKSWLLNISYFKKIKEDTDIFKIENSIEVLYFEDSSVKDNSE